MASCTRSVRWRDSLKLGVNALWTMTCILQIDKHFGLRCRCYTTVKFWSSHNHTTSCCCGLEWCVSNRGRLEITTVVILYTYIFTCIHKILSWFDVIGYCFRAVFVLVFIISVHQVMDFLEISCSDSSNSQWLSGYHYLLFAIFFRRLLEVYYRPISFVPKASQRLNEHKRVPSSIHIISSNCGTLLWDFPSPVVMWRDDIWQNMIIRYHLKVV